MAKKKPKNDGRGKASKYNKGYVLAVEMMAFNAMIDKDMAKKIGIADSTFNKWKNDHPEFGAAIKKGKETPDNEVIADLKAESHGYYKDEITQIRKPGKDGKEEVVSTQYTHRWYRPSTGAQVFWLKNRCGWVDKQEIYLNPENDPMIILAKSLKGFQFDEPSK